MGLILLWRLAITTASCNPCRIGVEEHHSSMFSFLLTAEETIAISSGADGFWLIKTSACHRGC